MGTKNRSRLQLPEAQHEPPYPLVIVMRTERFPQCRGAITGMRARSIYRVHNCCDATLTEDFQTAEIVSVVALRQTTFEFWLPVRLYVIIPFPSTGATVIPTLGVDFHGSSLTRHQQAGDEGRGL